MPLILSQRRPELVENMDQPDCDTDLLYNTYEQFHRINNMLSRWKHVYGKYIKPELDPSGPNSILDIGFGGGDIPLSLSEWARNDGFDVHITGIETDKRSWEYANSLNVPENITFLHRSSGDTLKDGQVYDIVLSNHLIHHLGSSGLKEMMDQARILSRKKVIFNDIERSDLGYAAFNIFSRMLFSNSFITEDGLISIKKSYTAKELRKAASAGWKVRRVFPYRLLLIYDHE